MSNIENDPIILAIQKQMADLSFQQSEIAASVTELSSHNLVLQENQHSLKQFVSSALESHQTRSASDFRAFSADMVNTITALLGSKTASTVFVSVPPTNETSRPVEASAPQGPRVQVPPESPPLQTNTSGFPETSIGFTQIFADGRNFDDEMSSVESNPTNRRRTDIFAGRQQPVQTTQQTADGSILFPQLQSVVSSGPQYVLSAPPFTEMLENFEIKALIAFILKVVQYRTDYNLPIPLWRHFSGHVQGVLETRFTKDFAVTSFASFSAETLFDFIRQVVQPTSSSNFLEQLKKIKCKTPSAATKVSDFALVISVAILAYCREYIQIFEYFADHNNVNIPRAEGHNGLLVNFCKNCCGTFGTEIHGMFPGTYKHSSMREYVTMFARYTSVLTGVSLQAVVIERNLASLLPRNAEPVAAAHPSPHGQKQQTFRNELSYLDGKAETLASMESAPNGCHTPIFKRVKCNKGASCPWPHDHPTIEKTRLHYLQILSQPVPNHICSDLLLARPKTSQSMNYIEDNNVGDRNKRIVNQMYDSLNHSYTSRRQNDLRQEMTPPAPDRALRDPNPPPSPYEQADDEFNETLHTLMHSETEYERSNRVYQEQLAAIKRNNNKVMAESRV